MECKGWLIYSEVDAIENRSFIDWFISEAKRKNISLELVLREQLSVGILKNSHIVLRNGSYVELPYFAVVRTVDPLLSRQLEHLGVMVFNSSAISELCNHKGKTYYEIAKLGIPMVDTLFIKKENIHEIPPLPSPFVIKEVAGRGGKQVYFIRSQTEWDNVRKQITFSEFVVQSTNVQLGKDLRVFIVGKKIIGAVLRESDSDFRANYKLGGSAKWYELSASEKQLIDSIINRFEFGMVGIDFLISHDGVLLFNEIEDVVGSRTLSAVSDVNILEEYISYIINQLTKHQHK